MNRTPPRSKPLPTRPSADIGSGRSGGAQNGYRDDNGNQSYAPFSSPRVNESTGGPMDPSGKTVLEGYRQDIMNGFEVEKPRYNPMNLTRPQSSTLLNVNDAIQVHLLVETALGDSSEYEILSQEEVDDLKKQVQYLSHRVEQTKQNLAIQSKYRDAAINMSRLYSHSNKGSTESGERKRRSILGHNRNTSHESREADEERVMSERRCEELAAELWSLEKRMMEPQSRLLKHTAGILQMTHKGPKKVPKDDDDLQPGAIPGSPESMYTYHNARHSMEPVSEENFFDERSLYRSADGFGNEMPREILAPAGPSKEQIEMIVSTEQRLEELNARLREVLVKSSPRLENYGPSPISKAITNGTNFNETLQDHLNYLERSISTIDREHDQSSRQRQESDAAQGNLEQMETVMMGLWDIIQSGDEEARQRKGDRRQTRTLQNLPEEDDDSPDEGGDGNETFSLQAFSAKVQWLYTQATRLKDQKKVLQRQIKQQRELNNKSDETKDVEMAEKVEELQRTTALLIRTENDADTVREQLSQLMEKFDGVQQEQTIREQSRSTSESTALRAAQDELNQRQISLDEKSKALAALEDELQDLKDDSSIGNAELQAKFTDSETKIADLTQQLAAAAAATAASQNGFEAGMKEKDVEIQKKEKEMEEMNMDLARLQTEVTIARAELDGAYGSRAQRAAEVAANPAIQKEIDELTLKNMNLAAEIAQLKEKGASGGESHEKMKTLRKELQETIEEYELMTKASIEWEKDREHLEGTIDKLRDEREKLDAELSDEKVRWLGMRSPGVEGGSSGPMIGNTSTTVLKNEFKKMMRDTRAENTKILRAEQAERRRLEDELRALKKQHGPGRSGLSQSFGSS